MAFSIDQKTKKAVFVINPPIHDAEFSPETFTKLVSWCLENCDVYAYIVHDLDIDENGVAKRVHIHMYAQFKACKRVITHINSLASWLGYDTLQISAQVASSNPAGFFQYLIHKNNPEKHQYEPREICSNLDAGEVNAMLESDAGNVSFSRFVSLCSTCETLMNVIEAVGLDVYVKYNKALAQIWKDCEYRRQMKRRNRTL